MATITPDQAAPVQELVSPVAHRSTKSSHGQILKSSALVGGSQILNIVISMVRTKAMALILGPSGFGLFGIYNSIVNLGQNLAGMGINSSGVRQIAAAVSLGDNTTIAETALVLRRVAVLLGLLGAVLMVLFSGQISEFTFASREHASDISWLSVAVFLTLISASQTALIQGMRRIGDLAKLQVLGALFATLFSIPLVYFFHRQGIVASLICIAAMTIATSWWYSQKISIRNLHALSMPFVRIRHEVSALLKLGIAFMTSSLITLGVAYVVRVMVLRRISFEATGLYQSAWTLGGLYVGFILQAMGADFYPRLTASAHDDMECNRLVNEQAQVGILLAGPGVLASISLAPLVIDLFYSSKFGAAVGVLRWICLGTMLQVISWPMGFVIVAKARRGLFIGCEVGWGVVSVALAWLCVNQFRLTGAGIASFGSYIFHGLMLYVIVSRMTGFRWSRENQITGLISLSLLAIVFSGLYLLPLIYGVALGIVATILHAIYSMRVLATFIATERIPAPIRKLFRRVGLISENDIRLV
jgi:PST family polysaccharide transporter